MEIDQETTAAEILAAAGATAGMEIERAVPLANRKVGEVRHAYMAAILARGRQIADEYSLTVTATPAAVNSAFNTAMIQATTDAQRWVVIRDRQDYGLFLSLALAGNLSLASIRAALAGL